MFQSWENYPEEKLSEKSGDISILPQIFHTLPLAQILPKYPSRGITFRGESSLSVSHIGIIARGPQLGATWEQNIIF